MATSIPFRYSAPVRWIHWVTVLLVATAYLTSESAEELGDGGGGPWHVFAGLALLLFVVVQPLLGVLMVWAEGEGVPVPFTALHLPPLLMLGEAWGESLEEVHETLGNAFYAVIALHALAAMWHQFVRRDGVLRRMW